MHLSALHHCLVQIHGAHGYLLEEFLKTSTNKRTDQYGVHMMWLCFAQTWWQTALQAGMPWAVLAWYEDM
jgi:NADH:flavin oxidoreductase / NADH oxidase family